MSKNKQIDIGAIYTNGKFQVLGSFTEKRIVVKPKSYKQRSKFDQLSDSWDAKRGVR